MSLALPATVQSDLQSLAGKLRPQLPSIALLVITFEETSQRKADDALWHHLHGLRGIRRMCRNGSVLVRISKVLDRAGADAPLFMARRNAVMWIAFIACGAESFVLRMFPELCLPRPLARFATEHYAEMCAEVRACGENYQEWDVNLFDAMI